MNDEILDEPEGLENDNGSRVKSIAIVAVISLLILFGLEKLRPSLPENLYERGDVQIKTLGLLLLILLFLLARVIPGILNKGKPVFGEYKIAIYTALILASIEFVYLVFQNVFFFNNGFDLDYLGILKASVFFWFFRVFIFQYSNT